ncbi:MAG: integral membrane sensor signal transduction histidine kinase [Halanaerobium sp. 4-GBenrich]|uniref:histidine kinase n=2 Tax=Halanaerobium congolense TaxID=54121 RepID=A0A1G6QC58_9FIRM|nr:ATP-binding protein [Halanaerobium congolense]KXS49477.1 MAG: integral membrane sensor signal transduction histidine kinase [Halanaerobium sp. T82-1]ODS50130.1 MAG: integral membrane sensor signal transduction histidine kinase [Halanaerobium sp. 4-GBenrich]OEG62219.1 MAG: two-component sensor histidine kinase [Halanaerobium sp. MDAL1]PUU92127.1 MAG: integral membrane sensor signal transduction histidine kinase [Halanaerobium sp.]PTX17913.1 heavy metal sensor kinase [Halanaerobium congolense
MFDFFSKKSKISWKITILYAFMFMMLLFLVNLSIYFFLSSFIDDNIQKSINNTSELVLSQFSGIGDPVNFFETDILQQISRSEENIFFRVLDKDGKVNAQSKYLENMDIPFSLEIEEFRSGNKIMAVKTIPVNKFVFSRGYLQVVRDITFEKNFLDFLIIVLTFAAGIGALISVFLGYFTTRKMLSPINKVTEAARKISSSDLGRRLEVSGPDDELKKLALTFNSMLDRLEKSFKRQKQFVSDASHELRTPISVIKGYVDLLDRWGKEKEDVRDEAIDAIKKETDNMKKLMENLLLLARGDDSELKKEENLFDFNNLVEEIIKEFKVMESDITLIFEDDAEIEFYGDPNLFKQLFRIFLDNAVKFTAKNGKIKIKLGRLDKENFFFSIADDGPGISQSDLPFIFDRFYQADKSRSRKSNKGSGLGLAIAKQIIDSYNGTIEIESSEKEGTKFIVKLPLKEK